MWQSEKPLPDLELGYNDCKKSSKLQRVNTVTTIILIALILFVFTVPYAVCTMNTQSAQSNYTGIPAVQTVVESTDGTLNEDLFGGCMPLLFGVRFLNFGLSGRYGFFLSHHPKIISKHPHSSFLAIPNDVLCTLSAAMFPLSFIGIPLCLWLYRKQPGPQVMDLLYIAFSGDRKYWLIIFEPITALWAGVMGFVYVSRNTDMNTLLTQEGGWKGVPYCLEVFVVSAPYYLKVCFVSAPYYLKVCLIPVGRLLYALIWALMAVLVAALFIVLIRVGLTGDLDFLSGCFKWLTSGGKVPAVG